MDGQLAWYIGGPAIGLCVVACRALFSGRLGVTGGFSEIVAKARLGSLRLDWRGWFVVGLVLGGTLYAVLNGGPRFHDYGWLTRNLDSGVLIGAILLVCGVAIGYGAKTAGGCTSGNGLSGTSLLSPAAFVATGTFFATGIAVNFVIKALI